MEGVQRLETHKIELGISAQVWYKCRVPDALPGGTGGGWGLSITKEVDGTKVEVMDTERDIEFLCLKQD